jgi:hypothetical protein
MVIAILQAFEALALAVGVRDINEILDARLYDTSSRVRSPFVGEILVWQNTSGYFLATKIPSLNVRSSGDVGDEITLEYRIAPAKSPSFSKTYSSSLAYIGWATTLLALASQRVPTWNRIAGLLKEMHALG